jgi:hypothetical protein
MMNIKKGERIEEGREGGRGRRSEKQKFFFLGVGDFFGLS